MDQPWECSLQEEQKKKNAERAFQRRRTVAGVKRQPKTGTGKGEGRGWAERGRKTCRKHREQRKRRGKVSRQTGKRGRARALEEKERGRGQKQARGVEDGTEKMQVWGASAEARSIFGDTSP